MTRPTVTGSARRDALLLCALAAAIVGLAPRLRVYYGVVVVRFEARALAPGGGARPLATPPELERPGFVGSEPGFPASLAPRLGRITSERARAWSLAEGEAVEWTVRWSERSPERLDRSETFAFERDGRARR